MGSDIKSHIKESIEDIQQYVDTEVGRITTQIEDVVTRVSALMDTQTTEFDPEVPVIMSRVPQNEDEDIHQTAEKIIHEGLRLPEVRVVRAMRLLQRGSHTRAASTYPTRQSGVSRVILAECTLSVTYTPG